MSSTKSLVYVSGNGVSGNVLVEKALVELLVETTGIQNSVYSRKISDYLSDL